MTKKTFSTLALFALAGCGQTPPAEAPPAAAAEPAPAGEAAPATAAAAAPAAPATKLPPATADERAKFVQSCWAEFNAKDWQKFPGCYAESASSEQVDMMPPFVGRNDIIEKNVKGYASAFPDGTGELELTLVNGNNIVSVVLFRGTNSGPLVGPMGTMPATNKKVGYLLAHVIETAEDGRGVQHDRFYSDGATLMGQLGMNPGPHRKLIEVGWPEKPVVLAMNSDAEKANLAASAKGIEAFNKHDVAAMLAGFTDDGVFSDVAAPADTVGKAALKHSFDELFKAFGDVKLDVAHSWAAGDYVVMEGTFSGTNTGDMPSWKLKKTGKHVSARYVEVDKFVGGKVKNAWLFDNGMSFAMQLGMVPPHGAKDSKAPAGKDPHAAPAAKDPHAAPGAPAAKDPHAAPAAKEPHAATPATPATPAKPATPATPAKPATPATPAKPATPAAPKK